MAAAATVIYVVRSMHRAPELDNVSNLTTGRACFPASLMSPSATFAAILFNIKRNGAQNEDLGPESGGLCAATKSLNLKFRIHG